MGKKTTASKPLTKGCQFFVSMERPECGKKSVARVTVKRRDGSGETDEIELCAQHKAKHDETFARLRAAGRKAAD